MNITILTPYLDSGFENIILIPIKKLFPNPALSINIQTLPTISGPNVKNAELKIHEDDIKSHCTNADIVIVCCSKWFKKLSGKPLKMSKGVLLNSSLFSAQLYGLPNYYSVKFNAAVLEDLKERINLLPEAFNSPKEVDLTKFKLIHILKPHHLVDYLNEEYLVVDIETTDLSPFHGKIYSIAISNPQDKGLVFLYKDRDKYLLKEFFEKTKGKLVFHNAMFDMSWILRHIFMEEYGDTQGMVDSLSLCDKVDDTILMLHIKLNSCSDTSKSLKDNTSHVLGNYGLGAEAFRDVTKVPLPKLLEYNATDNIATNYLYKKHKEAIFKDFSEIYSLMTKSIKLFCQCTLTGLPINPKTFKKIKQQMYERQSDLKRTILSNKFTERALVAIKMEKLAKRNASLKTKQSQLDYYDEVTFNINSKHQLTELIYNQLQCPVIDLTDTGNPSCAEQSLATLVYRKEGKSTELLQQIMEYNKLTTIITKFIVLFEDRSVKHDGWWYIHGGYNIHGTKSGRISSSNPNMTQLPSTSEYGKLIKSMFEAPDKKVFAGADYESLEDKINTLLTHDPNKMAVYTEGYDGHSLRASEYFPEEVPIITEQLNQLDLAKEGEELLCVTLEDGTDIYITKKEYSKL